MGRLFSVSYRVDKPGEPIIQRSVYADNDKAALSIAQERFKDGYAFTVKGYSCKRKPHRRRAA
jgi:hypothetical protein